jgi:hypothetical protein
MKQGIERVKTFSFPFNRKVAKLIKNHYNLGFALVVQFWSC